MKRHVRSHALAARSIVLLLAALGCALLARAETTTYTYDALGRLIQEQNASAATSAVWTDV
jgi:YD repeat-containing protein